MKTKNQPDSVAAHASPLCPSVCLCVCLHVCLSVCSCESARILVVVATDGPQTLGDRSYRTKPAKKRQAPTPPYLDIHLLGYSKQLGSQTPHVPSY